MSHAYVVRPKVDKSGETEKIRYYGVPVTSGQVSTEQLATYISTRCTFSRGEILAAIIEIGREIQFQLDMGIHHKPSRHRNIVPLGRKRRI